MDLPRPFGPSTFPREKRDAAEALWAWHHALLTPAAPALDGGDLTAYFEAEQQNAAAGDPLKVVPEGVWTRAYAACAAHDLPTALLARQVRAARKLHRAPERSGRGKARFATSADLNGFLRHWTLPHGLLLAKLAGAGHAWQERPIFELSRGFFLTARLLRLPQDLRDGRLFFPEADLRQYGVSIQFLRDGPPGGEDPPENVQRLLWKQSVRARDALAQGQEALAKELPRRYARASRRCWLGALDLLDQIEQRDYDLWSRRFRLAGWRRTRAWLQSLLGRAGR